MRCITYNDTGGPYREVFDSVCVELQSAVVPLFVPCANNKADAGDGRDQFVPCVLPSADQGNGRATRLAAYNFVGQLLGLAIRSQNLLPLNWPSLVWKQLVNDPVTLDDLKKCDVLTFQLLGTMKKSMAPELFDIEMDDVRFEVLPAGASESVPLIPGGSHARVNYTNRAQYYDALLAFRLSEFNQQCEAIRQGLATVVPFPFLPILSWQQLERQVCGGSVDIDLLERNTTYEYCSSSDSFVQLFWQMMRERFDDRARAAFLKFVWGRYVCGCFGLFCEVVKL